MRALRTDSNLTEIVGILRKLGLRVYIWNGAADLICAWGGISVVCEVRPANKPKKARQGAQEAFQALIPTYWLQTPADCLELVKTLRKWHLLISKGVSK